MKLIGTDIKIATFFYEFLVLFASIYGAFQLEEWGQNRENIEREEAYLASMHQDLRKDVNQLNRRVVDYQSKIESANEVLRLLEAETYEQNRLQILELFKTNLIYQFNYNPINNTLVTLKSSGDLKLIQNYNFKLLLSELDKSYSTTLGQGIIFNNYIEGDQWSGFYITHFDTNEMTIIGNPNPFLLILFRNKMRHYIKLLENYYFELQGCLKKTEEVMLALEMEMERREIRFDEAGGLDTEIAEDSLSLELDDLLEELESDSILNSLEEF